MIGDADYKVTDLERRIKVLENKARAVNPGNAPSRGPDHPMRPVTSAGQVIPGVDSDLSSRIHAAIEAGLTSVESVQDVNIAQKTVNFGGGTTQTLYQTNYLRPDPIVGDTYRVSAGGIVTNSTGSPIGATIQWSMAGNAVAPNYVTMMTVPSFASGNMVTWWLLILATVTAGGLSGAYLLNTRCSITGAAGGPGGNVTTDFIAASPVSPINLVAPAPTIQVVGGVASASLSVTLNQYCLERLGATYASKI